MSNLIFFVGSTTRNLKRWDSVHKKVTAGWAVLKASNRVLFLFKNTLQAIDFDYNTRIRRPGWLPKNLQHPFLASMIQWQKTRVVSQRGNSFRSHMHGQIKKTISLRVKLSPYTWRVYWTRPLSSRFASQGPYAHARIHILLSPSEVVIAHFQLMPKPFPHPSNVCK
jgi:hypothetical protein